MGKLEYIITKTTKEKEIIDITDGINERLPDLKAKDGICHIFLLHTTAGLTTSDLDPGTDQDMLDAFSKIIPQLNYRHPHNPEHVKDHIISSILGTSVSVPVKDGKMVLGDWQRVILVELDGPRDRRIKLSFIPTKR